MDQVISTTQIVPVFPVSRPPYRGNGMDGMADVPEVSRFGQNGKNGKASFHGGVG